MSARVQLAGALTLPDGSSVPIGIEAWVDDDGSDYDWTITGPQYNWSNSVGSNLAVAAQAILVDQFQTEAS